MRRTSRRAWLGALLVLCGSTLWSGFCHAAEGVASKQETFVVELRVNAAATSADFYDVVRDASGRVFVPAAFIFELGEASASVAQGVLRLEVMSTQQSMVVDPGAKTLSVNGESRPLTADDFIAGDQTLLINKTLLETVFDLEMTLSEEAQRLTTATRRPWPIDLRLARERRWGHLDNQQEDVAVTSVEVRQDYAMWGAPQADVALTQSGRSVSHSALIVGEIGLLTAQLFASGANGTLSSHRLLAGRTDPEGRAFGIPGLYDLQVGDVQPMRQALIGTGPQGQGLTFSGQPLDRPVNFDTTVIEGDALPGWDAELVLGQSIVDFMRVGADGRYRFVNIPLGYGTNVLRVVLHGPQGQTRERVYRQTVGGDMVPVGQLYTRGYLLQNAANAGGLSGAGSTPGTQAPRYSGMLAVDYGLSKSLTTGFFVAQVPDAQARGGAYGGFSARSAIEGLSVGLSMVSQQDAAAHGHAQAAQWVMNGALAELSVSFSHDRYGEAFHSPANQNGLITSLTKLRLAMPFSLPKMSVMSVMSGWLTPATADPGKATAAAAASLAYAGVALDQTVQRDGSRIVTPSLQLSHGAGDWSLTHMLNYNMTKPPPPGDAFAATASQRDGSYRLLGTQSIGQFNLRGSIERQLAPAPAWKTVAVSASYRDGLDSWNSEINHVATVFGYSANWSRDLGWAYLSVGGGWSKSTGVSIGTSLNFTLSGTGRGSVDVSGQYKATQGQADVTVYNRSASGHTNDVIPAAHLTLNRSAEGRSTDTSGQAKFLGLSTTEATLLNLDRDSLPDNFLVPMVPSIRFWSRAGQSIHLEIPVTESGEISGRLALDTQQGLAGILLQVLDTQGRVYSETRSLNDGYFMFDTVYAGGWTVRLGPDQTWRTKRLTGESAQVTLGAAALQVGDVVLTVHAAP